MASSDAPWARMTRVAYAVTSCFVAESLILALSAWLPLFGLLALHRMALPAGVRLFVMLLAVAPAYTLFALLLLMFSGATTRALGWRVPPGANHAIRDYEWPLLDWGRGLIITHIARLFGGVVFRSTPVWNLYLRFNGARVGRGTWINSLSIMDHHLLEIGDHVVIGSDAHISAHVVERGRLYSAPVRIEGGVTIGIESVIECGVVIGSNTRVGALSVVPKHTILEPDAIYVGAPAHRLERPARNDR